MKTDLEIFIDELVSFASGRRCDFQYFKTFTIQQEVDLIRFIQPFDFLVAVAGQPDLNIVGTGHGKNVR